MLNFRKYALAEVENRALIGSCKKGVNSCMKIYTYAYEGYGNGDQY